MGNIIAKLILAGVILVQISACASSADRTLPIAESCAAAIEPGLPVPGGDILPPKVVRRVPPIAPAHMLGGPQRTAVVEAIIGEDGRPRHICLAAGDSEWGEAVMAAVRQWEFEPATRDGQPIAVRFILTTRFRD